MSRALLPEVLTQIHNIKDPVIKSQILKANETPGLLHVLRHAFTPQITFNDMGGVPEYNPSFRPPGTNLSSLEGEARRLYVFTDQFAKITPLRKRELILQLLESVHASEAELLKQVIAKNVKVNGLTPELVENTFPGLLSWEGKLWNTTQPQQKNQNGLNSKAGQSTTQQPSTDSSATKSVTKRKRASNSKQATT